MSRITKADLKKRVNLAARQYGISSVLFRHLVGERLGVNVTDMECLGLLFHKGLASPTGFHPGPQVHGDGRSSVRRCTPELPSTPANRQAPRAPRL